MGPRPSCWKFIKLIRSRSKAGAVTAHHNLWLWRIKMEQRGIKAGSLILNWHNGRRISCTTNSGHYVSVNVTLSMVICCGRKRELFLTLAGGRSVSFLGENSRETMIRRFRWRECLSEISGSEFLAKSLRNMEGLRRVIRILLRCRRVFHRCLLGDVYVHQIAFDMQNTEHYMWHLSTCKLSAKLIWLLLHVL